MFRLWRTGAALPTCLHSSLISLISSLVSLCSSLISLHSSLISLRYSLVSLHSSLISLHSSLISLISSLVSLRSSLVSPRASELTVTRVQLVHATPPRRPTTCDTAVSVVLFSIIAGCSYATYRLSLYVIRSYGHTRYGLRYPLPYYNRTIQY